ncbi:MAG: PDZ domain-containing protein [Acidimicrobiia bacterium]
MNEDPGHDPTVPASPVDPTEEDLPAPRAETTAAETTATNEPVTGADSGSEPGQAPPNLPPRAVAADPPRRRSIAVPMWAAAVLGALIIFGIGLLGGYAIGSEEGHGDREGRWYSHDGGRESDDAGRQTDSSRRRGGFNQRPLRPLVPPTRVPRGNNGGQAPSRPQPANPTGAFLGVSVQDSTNPAGATVVQLVAAGPAGSSGLKAGDVVTAIDGTSIKDAAALTAWVRSQQPGTKVVVTYSRDGATATADVTLGDRAQLRAQ